MQTAISSSRGGKEVTSIVRSGKGHRQFTAVDRMMDVEAELAVARCRPFTVQLTRIEDTRNGNGTPAPTEESSSYTHTPPSSKSVSLSVNDKDFSNVVESMLELVEDDIISEEDTSKDFSTFQPRTFKIHREALVTDRAKRLDYLLNQAEVFSHFMRPSYSVALKPSSAMDLDSIEAAPNRIKKPKKAMKMLLEAGTGHASTQISDEVPASYQTVYDSSPNFIVNGTMRDYQVRGLNWLISLYENGINGILADEMGLGKTIQTIAMLGYLKHTRDIHGPHLIIVPKATLPNWVNEFAKWCPSLKTICFFGNKQERPAFIRDVFLKKKWNVCITSYDIVRIEFSVLRKLNWLYLVIDEAQRIKNEASVLATYVRLLKSKSRLILTGTPLQNNVHELWALLNYLLPDVFDSAEDFDSWFNTSDCITDSTLVSRLHGLLRPFLLRRIKSDVEHSLLPKIEIKLYVSITQMQRDWYRQVLLKDIDSLNPSSQGKRSQLHNLLMHLRKVCNHPYLFPGAEPEPHTTGPHLVDNCGKMIVLDKLLAKLKLEGSRVLVFCQMTMMMDILEDYCWWRKYEYCRLDGRSSDLTLRQESIDIFNAPNSSKFLFLISTRAGGLGINLATADVVILYDSDWNPQVDLQAQDRAHRIGQTKQVRVFRLVTENTVEEKILEKAEIKLRLDRNVIQRGRLVDTTVTAAQTQESLRSILAHGAAEILSDRAFVSPDCDIDDILKKSKERADVLASKLSVIKDSVTNFTLEEDAVPIVPIDFHKFEGADYRLLRTKEQNLKKYEAETTGRKRRPILSNEINYYEDEGAAGSSRSLTRTSSSRVCKPAPNQQVHPPNYLHDFQFYPHRLYELFKQEVDVYRAGGKWQVKFSDDLNLQDAAALQKFEQSRIRNVRPLTKAEMAEKRELERGGFPTWTKPDFKRYLNLLSTHGEDKLELMVNSIRGKTVEEVVAYHQVFNVKCHEICDYGTVFRKSGLDWLVAKCNLRLENLLDMKVSQYSNPKLDLKIKYSCSPSLQGTRFTPEQDRDLIMALFKIGFNSCPFKLLHETVRQSPEFDPFLRSRTVRELQSRCNLLLHLIDLEFDGGHEQQMKAVDDSENTIPCYDLTQDSTSTTKTDHHHEDVEELFGEDLPLPSYKSMNTITINGMSGSRKRKCLSEVETKTKFRRISSDVEIEASF